MMNEITDKYDYVKKSIPDPQVKDVADQFFGAAEYLWAKPPGSGVLIPAIVNSVLAIELYLKSLTAYSVIKNLDDYGGGVQGGVVTAEPEKLVHKLTEIFNAMEESIKKEFEDRYVKSNIFRSNSRFSNRLRAYDNVFVKVRYVFEDSSVFKSVDINELQQLMRLTRDVVELLPRKETMIK
jgi:hypothetical protein